MTDPAMPADVILLYIEMCLISKLESIPVTSGCNLNIKFCCTCLDKLEAGPFMPITAGYLSQIKCSYFRMWPIEETP
jgi:hypothetical protein